VKDQTPTMAGSGASRRMITASRGSPMRRGAWSVEFPDAHRLRRLHAAREFAPGFEQVWPIVGLADVEGGPESASVPKTRR
jgi:hypothetical protein